MRFVSQSVASFSVLYCVSFLLLSRPFNFPETVLALCLSLPLIWLSIRDLSHFEIPDLATATLAVISLFWVAFTSPQWLVTNIVTGCIVAATLWLVGWVGFRLRGEEVLGIGDAKLLGAGALLLGPWALPELFLLASIGGILAHLIAARNNSETTMKGIPFGPFIAYAIFVLSFLDPLFI